MLSNNTQGTNSTVSYFRTTLWTQRLLYLIVVPAKCHHWDRPRARRSRFLANLKCLINLNGMKTTCERLFLYFRQRCEKKGRGAKWTLRVYSFQSCCLFVIAGDIAGLPTSIKIAQIYYYVHWSMAPSAPIDKRQKKSCLEREKEKSHNSKWH